MIFRRWFFSLLLLACSPLVRGASYAMDFPVRLNQIEVAQLTARVDGMTLVSVNADEFKANLEHYLSAEVNLWLDGLEGLELSLAELKAHGIELSLNPQDLTLTVQLAEIAMAIDSLTYTRTKGVMAPVNEGAWSLLNNFNLNHRRSNNNHNYDSAFEWLFDGNIGGGQGINYTGSGFWQRSDSHQSQFYRGDFKLFYDWAEKPLRLSFGDQQNRVVGHLGSYQLGGFNLSKAYSALQPQRDLTPGNSQIFVLPRAAELEVYVNGFLVSRLRARPGRYDIKDLPLTSGSNNIRLLATYADGENEQFVFSTHYNAQLLAAGISDYDLSVGFSSSVSDRVYHYGDALLLTGSYEYGWSDQLTLGFNALVHEQGQLAGVTMATGSPWGNLSWRLSASATEQHHGYALTLDSEHSVFGQSAYGAANLRLGWERKSDFVASPWFEQVMDHQRYYLDYSYYVNDHIDINLFTTISINAAKQRSRDLSGQINWRYQGLSLAAGYRYQSQGSHEADDEGQFFVNLIWNLYDHHHHSRNRLRYNSRSKIATLSHTRVNRNYLNDYGYEAMVERGSDFRREQVKASHTANWWRTDVVVDNVSRDDQLARSHVNLNLATSVGVVDGQFGIGTNVTAPFALVRKHRTLAANEVLVNVDSKGRAQSQSGQHIGAIVNLGSAYSAAQFNVDVPEAPLGYDWGPGTYQLAGGAATGHYYLVGSDLSYTVLGVFKAPQGEAVSLKRGKLILNDSHKTYEFFTNRTGRFVVEGIGAGSYRVEIEGLTGQLILSRSIKHFVNLGEITLEFEP